MKMIVLQGDGEAGSQWASWRVSISRTGPDEKQRGRKFKGRKA